MSAGNYYAAPHGAPPQQQQWGAPPPQQQFGGAPNQFQQPPPQQFGGAPPHQPPYPGQMPPQNFQAPPPQGYQQPGFPPQGVPPSHMGQHAPPMQQQMPPQQQFGQMNAPSLGYGMVQPQTNAGPDVDALIKAMSGFKRDHSTIIRVLAKADPIHMAAIKQTYAQRNGGSSLESKVESSFRSHYGDCLLQLVRGPLLSDVHNVNRAVKGLGTKEDMLNDVLIGRTNADMQAIKAAYQQTFKRTMESDVEGDLSLKTKTMFQLILRASRTDESYPYNPVEIGRDTEAIHQATRGPSVATNQETVFTILTQRSDNQIRAIAHDFQQKYHKSLEDTITSNFSGHMQDALLLALGRAMDRAKSDAYGLEATMKGLGTKDNLLVNETVRVHWNRQHMDQVRKAYQHFFKKDLVQRVKGETSGDYRDALVACLT